ncbi:hypothetical protein [Rickettsia amblyommatis]|uniref:Uncharacterized protein n=1 Tax=Rickettsia amblyommatis str. Ac/Pa TaxID=1359164 RepID=A0A0F3N060_RICAM|nr:hypothetical protein [Rickettsia amblyommatis]ALA61343.1 hypothetical protein AL573_00775 [Rickettsia amblyommatis]KJV61428.1 hypothetical protein APHACPA_0435 [Rickettsia amblyommatis str. Ac/Pa]
MAIDSEDMSTYATAAATIIGAITVAPVLIIKDKTTTFTSDIWKSLKEYYTRPAVLNKEAYNQNLIEHTNQDGWNVITIGGSSCDD